MLKGNKAVVVDISANEASDPAYNTEGKQCLWLLTFL